MKTQDKKMKKKEFHQELYDLRRQSRERYLKLFGVDVNQLRELEGDIDNEFGELVANLQDQLRNEGKERTEQQTKILELSRATLSQNAEKALHADLSTSAAILNHLRIEQLDPGQITPIWFCHCHYTRWLFNNLGNGDEVNIDPPPPTGTGQASINYETTLNQANPYADVRGAGTGTINTATVRTFYKFAFTPESDGTYCIKPFVSMNGWWLLWTWGACGGTSEDIGRGTVRVKLKSWVDQLSVTVKKNERIVLEEHRDSGLTNEGAIDYVSTRDGGIDMTVNLLGGHEAIIFVECDVFTQMSNHGRAIVDMQSGSNFYFRVPLITIGKRHCHWPWEFFRPWRAQIPRSLER